MLLRWGLQHGLVVLPKSTKPARIAENGALFDFALDDRAMNELDALEEGLVTGGIRPTRIDRRQGGMIRPGAALSPTDQWQELQSFSPACRGAIILLVTPSRMTSAVYGNRFVPGQRSSEKLPLVFDTSSTRVLSAPVIATVTLGTPAQFVSSFSAFITEPASTNDGPS